MGPKPCTVDLTVSRTEVAVSVGSPGTRGWPLMLDIFLG